VADYLYKGVNKEGKRVSGQMAAASDGEVRLTLRSQGVRPTRIDKMGVMNTGLSDLFSGGKPNISLELLLAFTRQLNVLISAGIPLVQALDVLSEQAGAPAVKKMIIAIRSKVSEGSYLWESLNLYPTVFPRLYIALVRAGEASGAMEEMLKRLSRYLEDQDRIRKLLKSAMIYPGIVITVAIGVITLMLAFVIPKFEEMLAGSGQELPGPTKFVIAASHFVVSNALYLTVGIVGTAYFLIRFFKTEEGRAILDRVLFKSPLFGPLMQKAGVARFSRTMQTLLTAGINLIDAIDICRATVENAVLEAAIGKIRGEIEAGKTLGGVVGSLGVFPRMAVQMISVGESTGSLDKMLDRVADFYEEEVTVTVGGLTKLIEPILLVFLGGIVGGMLIAMYLPVFKMAGGAG
jgi:type IV pilus assembly protein PilC